MAAVSPSASDFLQVASTPSLADNDFVLLALDQGFEQSQTVLRERWTRLQSWAHPDNFAAQGANAQRLAMQWSVRINEAYQRLKSPLKRAQYLCELAGVAIGAEDNTTMPAAFLMQQIQWREDLEDIRTEAEAQALCDDIAAQLQAEFAAIAQAIDHQHDHQAAAAGVRRVMFLEKLLSEAQRERDRLAD